MRKTLFIAYLFVAFHAFAQVGIGTNTPNASSALDVTSTSKGLLLPRLTHTQKTAIVSPAAGLWIWCSDCGVKGEMQVYNGISWTNMAGGTATAPLLLDRLSAPSVAYSLRLLKASYTGKAIKVRRSNDDIESDIGFTSSGNLDEAALLSFVGSGDGFVTTWYDQSGNGNHAINITKSSQPQIVFSGAVNKMNNRPAIKGSIARNSRLERTPVSPIVINQYSVVGQGEANGTSYVIFLQQAGPSAHFRYNNTSGNLEAWDFNVSPLSSTTNQTTSILKIYSAVFPTGKLYTNGSEIGSGSTGTATGSASLYTLFNNPGNNSPLNGSLSEMILFSSAVDRAILESDQGTYYSITIN